MFFIVVLTGSDDARAPNFPAEVLGTRSDAPMDAMRSSTRMMPSSVSKPTDLSTIEELSVVQTSSSVSHQFYSTKRYELQLA